MKTLWNFKEWYWNTCILKANLLIYDTNLILCSSLIELYMFDNGPYKIASNKYLLIKNTI